MFHFKKKESHSQRLIDYPNTGIFIQNPLMLKQLNLIQLDSHHLQLIRAVKDDIIVEIDDIVNLYYESIEKIEQFRKIIGERSSSERLKKTLTTHLIELLEARIDDKYIEHRRHISIMHVKIGLTTEWYLAAFHKIETYIRQLIYKIEMPQLQKEQTIDALSKICNFEQQLVLQEYEKEATKVTEQQQMQIKLEVKQNIGTVANKLKGQSESTNLAVTNLVDNTRSVTAYLSSSVKEAEGTKQASLKGYEQMQLLSQHTAEINDRTIEMTKMVQVLDDSSTEIYKVIEIVKGIAGQTNLLALNSAIEAARAGEHGKGFAVVADEVRKLAEQSKKSATSIVSLTLEIKADTENVERAVTDSLASVLDGVEIITEAGESFTSIAKAVNVMSTQIEEISATSEQISASAEQVSASVNEIANGASESSGNLEMISAAVEEQTATMQQVSAVAVTLSERAQDLQHEIHQFKVK